MSTLANRINGAVLRAVTEVMNGCAPSLPPLSWSLREGRVSGMAHYVHYSDTEVVDVLSRWAAHFGLIPGEPAEGRVEYVGEIDGQNVRVWGIVDHVAWDARTVSLMS